jgi:hypothetical protein
MMPEDVQIVLGGLDALRQFAMFLLTLRLPGEPPAHAAP